MQVNEACDQIMDRKGHDYTSGANDRLANFKGIAARLDVSPSLVWAIYFLKHIDALATWASGKPIKSESLYSRFVDARNYLDLGLAIAVEEGEVDPHNEEVS